MYIESAELSEKHAEIKFTENLRYILRDCGSETGMCKVNNLCQGTWVRVRDLNLYEEHREREFKVGNYIFKIEECKLYAVSIISGKENFDELGVWLKKNAFQRYGEICK